MLNIPCPFCGNRNESEFIHGGPAKAARPENLADISDADWVHYLTVPRNVVGPINEFWWHVRGCGKWFTLTRNTLTHEINDSVPGYPDGG